MASTYEYDLAILGAGPGGYVAAIRAAQLNLKTVIIERDRPGGVCLNWGCIPSKALINQAEVFHSRKGLEELGCSVDVSGFNYENAYAASRKAADTLSKGVVYLLKKNKINFVSGTGVFKSAHEIEVNNSEKSVTAKNIIIATGSRPRVIPGFEFDESTILSSTGILSLKALPKSLLILGGGAIGVEFAHIMNAFGVEVHLVEMMSRLLPIEDEEVSELLRKSFVKRGVKVYTSTKALSYAKKDNGVDVILQDSADAKIQIPVEKILVVTGRTPNTDGIGLEKIGITTEKGYVPFGDYYQTKNDSVYAIGDVVATPLLAHVASKEGEIAVEHIAGHATQKSIQFDQIPGAVYCEPQIASFGMKLKEAKDKGIQCKETSFPYRGAGKSVAVGKPDGFVKIVFNEETHEILGAHIVGADASELIHELLLAKTTELLPNDLATMIHVHPTISETVMEAARAVDGWAIHV
ncbi:MAG TPA: dihydrolipoyl dehydrogenase [Chitinispirillaceae bacterium]|nr:dihydrolipoyl dehydrogenase [Chitinispirillaceae bacterium]